MSVHREVRRRAHASEVQAMARECIERLAETSKRQRMSHHSPAAFRFQAQTDERGVTAEMRELMARQASESPFHPTGG